MSDDEFDNILESIVDFIEDSRLRVAGVWVLLIGAFIGFFAMGIFSEPDAGNWGWDLGLYWPWFIPGVVLMVSSITNSLILRKRTVRKVTMVDEIATLKARNAKLELDMASDEDDIDRALRVGFRV